MATRVLRRRWNGTLVRTALLGIGIALGCAHVHAQDPSPIAQSVGRPKIPSNSVASVLDKLIWDPNKSGALLLIAPERLVTQGSNPMANLFGVFEPDQREIPDAFKPPALPASGPGGYKLETLASTVRRRLIREGSVSTFAPIDVPKSLANPLEAFQSAEMAELFAGLDAEPTLIQLMATFTDAQWSAASAPNGIGREQFDPNQRRLFDSLLPVQTTFWFAKGTAPAKQKEPSPEDLAKIFTGTVSPEEAIRALMPPGMEPAVRDSLRLRLRKELVLEAVSKDEPSAGGFTLEVPVDESRWDSADLMVKGIPANMITGGIGTLLKQVNDRQPALPKTSDASYSASALRVTIALGDVKTLGVLVDRIAKATGVALVCDRRIADVSIHTRGENASAGDLLKAITRSIHGTIRKLGAGDDAVFLLTENLVPASRQNNSFAASVMASMAPVQKRFAEKMRNARLARAEVARKDPLRRVGRGDVGDLPESLWQAAERFDEKSLVPIVQLSERWQKSVRDLWSEMDEETRSTQPAPDMAKASLRISGELVVPSTGAWTSVARISAKDLRPDSNLDVPVAPLNWPATATTRVARIPQPESIEQAGALAVLLRERGFTHWMADLPTLALPPQWRDIADVFAKAGLKGIPVLSPLHGEKAFPDIPRDISLTGETVRQWGGSNAVRDMAQKIPALAVETERLRKADYLVPEVVDPLSVLRAVEQTATLPGVVAVGLSDLAPSGYSGNALGELLWIGGGTLGARMRFVRSEGVDPADLAGDMGAMFGAADPLSIFANRTNFTWRDKWNKDMAKRRDALFARIDTALSRAQVGVPVLTPTQWRSNPGVWQRWTGKWESPFEPSVGDSTMEGAPRPPKPSPPPAKRAVSPERWVDIDTASFGSAADGFGVDDDIDDPHLLRPFEERLAAWIGDNVGRVLGTSDASGESAPDDDPDSQNGFVLNVSHWSIADAMGFLKRRIAPQAAPAVAGSSGAPTPEPSAAPKADPPKSTSPRPTAIPAPAPNVPNKTKPGSVKPAGKPVGRKQAPPKR